MTVLASASAVCALITTVPPSAASVPVLPISALAAPWLIFSVVRPSPAKSTVISCPAPSATVPSRATTVPLLLTEPPSIATVPPCDAVIEPALLTGAADVPTKWKRPARKSASEILSVDAIIEPTFTEEPCAKITPAGLTRNTLPFACKRPAITLGSLPITRLSSVDVADGWAIVTASFLPIENEFQLTMALEVPCVMFIWPALGDFTFTAPDTTWAPVGFASDGGP